MVVDVVRSYWEIASGLTVVTRDRAAATARALLAGDVGSTPIPGALGQVQSLTEELMALSSANRQLLRGLVSAEVDRALQLVGAASRDELAGLRRSIDRLALRVAALEEAGSGAKPVRARKPASTRKPTKKSATSARRTASTPGPTPPLTKPAAARPTPPHPEGAAGPADAGESA